MSPLRRVRDRGSFEELRRNGRRARSGPVSVTWLPEAPGSPPRLACSISRKVGSAVVRNRLRRRLRAIIAEATPDIPPGTYLLSAAPGAAGLTYGDLRRTVLTAIAALPHPDRPTPGAAR